MLGLCWYTWAFPSCVEGGLLLRWPLLLRSTGSRRAGFSSHGTRTLERRLSSCGARAQLLRGTWGPPRPGLEPVSPALADGLPTTAPPGKPQSQCYYPVSQGRALRLREMELYVPAHSAKKGVQAHTQVYLQSCSPQPLHTSLKNLSATATSLLSEGLKLSSLTWHSSLSPAHTVSLCFECPAQTHSYTPIEAYSVHHCLREVFLDYSSVFQHSSGSQVLQLEYPGPCISVPLLMFSLPFHAAKSTSQTLKPSQTPPFPEHQLDLGHTYHFLCAPPAHCASDSWHQQSRALPVFWRKNLISGTSLVEQWLRIRLPMQGTRV